MIGLLAFQSLQFYAPMIAGRYTYGSLIRALRKAKPAPRTATVNTI